MRFVSTRGGDEAGLSDAIQRGLARDGGLFVPQSWPSLAPSDFDGDESLAEVAGTLLAPFAAGDALAPDLASVATEALNFPVPLVSLDPAGELSVLELFHGPTAAFKDFGARFLASALSRIRRDSPRRLRILVATSGDTGGAVAAAFHNKPGIDVAVLFPKGLVSPAQEAQLTCWGGNVQSFAVRSTFDECQRMVKAAFGDEALRARVDLSSANSINLGRLLPQMTYFTHAGISVWRAHGEKLSFVIPSGNLGHVTACVWARRVGAPIGDIVIAHNANRTMPDYLESGAWRPRASVATLASAMDVGDPSNAERLFNLFPDVADLRRALTAYAIDDDAIRASIRRGFTQYGQIWCPHTATAAEALERHRQAGRAGGRWAIAATAHPAKFREIVEPLVGQPIPLPAALRALAERPRSCTEIAADLGALLERLT